MKAWDKYGRLLVKQQDAVITVSFANLIGDNFSIYNNKFYFRDGNTSNLTPYYESKTQVYQGIPNTGLADAGVALP